MHRGKEVKLSLFMGDMTLYLNVPKDSASRLLDLTVIFNTLGYKLTNTTKMSAFSF